MGILKMKIMILNDSNSGAIIASNNWDDNEHFCQVEYFPVEKQFIFSTSDSKTKKYYELIINDVDTIKAIQLFESFRKDFLTRELSLTPVWKAKDIFKSHGINKGKRRKINFAKKERHIFN